MVLRRIPKIENPELSRGFEGRLRVLAAIVQTALKQAGYEACFLGGSAERPGLSIGVHEGNAIGVTNARNPAGFPWSHAQVCAQRLNDQFRRSAASTTDLATAQRGVTSIGSVPYAEVVVRCPNDSVLRTLHKSFVK